MTFTLILLALFAERFLIDDGSWRRAAWFDAYRRRLADSNLAGWLLERYWGVLLLLAPPLVLVAMIQDLLGDGLWGLPAFAFALLVLLYSLGPDDLDSQVVDYLDSEERGDEEKARRFAGRICRCEAGADRRSRVDQLTGAVLAQSLRRLFAVVLWFFLLGPVGALLYRLVALVAEASAADEEVEPPFREGCLRLQEILDWLPARLVVYSFALAGNFDGALRGQADCPVGATPPELLVSAGKGALGIGADPEEAEPAQVEAAMSLVWRALTLWLAVMALLALSL